MKDRERIVADMRVEQVRLAPRGERVKVRGDALSALKNNNQKCFLAIKMPEQLAFSQIIISKFYSLFGARPSTILRHWVATTCGIFLDLANLRRSLSCRNLTHLIEISTGTLGLETIATLFK